VLFGAAFAGLGRAVIFMQQPADAISTFHRHRFRARPRFNRRPTAPPQ
jgi:hypothetical protein